MNKDTDKNKDAIASWNCGKRGNHLKECWSKKGQTNKAGSKEKSKTRTQRKMSQGMRQPQRQNRCRRRKSP